MSRADENAGEKSKRNVVVAAQVDRRAQFEVIVKLTRNMRARVQAGAWDDIVAMETERQELLNTFFAVEPAKSEARWIAESIQEMLDINNEMEEACRKHLDQIASDMSTLYARR